jgi:hypothetical protein
LAAIGRNTPRNACADSVNVVPHLAPSIEPIQERDDLEKTESSATSDKTIERCGGATIRRMQDRAAIDNPSSDCAAK